MLGYNYLSEEVSAVSTEAAVRTGLYGVYASRADSPEIKSVDVDRHLLPMETRIFNVQFVSYKLIFPVRIPIA